MARTRSKRVAFCLFDFLKNVDSKVKHIVFFFTAARSKNKIVFAALSAISASHKFVKLIDHKFLDPGHTHMECDNDHSIIKNA